MCPRHDLRSKRTFYLSQLALLCASLMYWPIRHYPTFHPDLMDGVRGAFFGVAIGAMILALRKGGQRPA